jgi:3-hydroxyisobutyrate dehydrogenase-like beta-hydroxyacid dehydrogenase
MIYFPSRSFSSPNLLYLGLGEMGHHIAGFFSERFPTTVWNRTYSKTLLHESLFKTRGLTGSNPFIHDISKVDLIFTCLPTSIEVETFVDLFISTNPQRKESLVWVDNTSGLPTHSKKISEKLAAARVGFIDAPVSGGRVGSANGTLAVMVGGKSEHFLRAEPVLKTIAKSLLHIGEEVGSAHAVKSYNNLLYGCNLVMSMKIAQSIKKGGMMEKGLKSIVGASGGSSAIDRVHQFEANDLKIGYRFKTCLLLKDMNIAFEQLALGPEDPVLEIFKDFYRIFHDGAQVDWEEHDVFDIYHFIDKSRE